MSTLAFDPFGAAQRADPYPAYAALRERSPVARVEPSGAYAVARYADVSFVLRHPELFSSSAMTTAMQRGFTSGLPQLATGDLARVAELARQLALSGQDVASVRQLIASDPPAHAPMRGLVNRGFTPRRIAQLEARVREIARERLAALEGRRDVEIVSELLVPLPVTVIAELLGVERERSADFKRWSDCAVAGATGGAGTVNVVQALEGLAELSAYLTEVVAQRRRDPKDDLVSTLIRAEDGETALTPAEVVGFVLLLLVAGNETTTNLLGNALLALLAHPDELARVQRDPTRIPALVEEVLRWDGPIQFLFREARQDVALGGVTIPAGSLVIPLLGSANRDEAQFPDAWRFDPARNTQGHLAFGLGIHFCLGASLARLEARVALEELLPRFERFGLAEPHVETVESFLVRGPKRLPLRVAWRGALSAPPERARGAHPLGR